MAYCHDLVEGETRDANTFSGFPAAKAYSNLFNGEVVVTPMSGDPIASKL